MPNAKATNFFIGSNSGCGFYSYFDAFYDSDRMRKVFLLKGGAGNGKSTLMKKIAAAAQEQGLDTEQIRCPSDPDSLDAVRIPAVGAAVIDATPPHAREAEYHGVLDRYVSLSEYVDSAALTAEREAVVRLSGEIRDRHDAARKCLAGAYSASNAAMGLVLGGVNSERISGRGAALVRRYIPKRHGVRPTKVYKRFFSGFTPKGLVAFPETLTALCASPASAELVSVLDDFGLSPFLLLPLLEAAQQNGFEVYAGYSPLVPSCLTSVVVPELSLVVAVNEHGIFDGAEAHVRNIRLNALIAPDVWKQNRTRLRILRRTERSLLEDAFTSLSEALCLHDALEAIYKPYTDYAGLDRLAEKLIDEILN